MSTKDPEAPGAHVLDQLFAVIESRRGADPDRSRTARLFQKGTKKIAQKVGDRVAMVMQITRIETGQRFKEQHFRPNAR